MEMLTPNALRQGGALGLLECHYSLSLPEDRPVEQQEGRGELFYKSQDIIRLSGHQYLSICWQFLLRWPIPHFGPTEDSTDSAGSSGTFSYTPNDVKLSSNQWKQQPIANSFSIHGTNGKSKWLTYNIVL